MSSTDWKSSPSTIVAPCRTRSMIAGPPPALVEPIIPVRASAWNMQTHCRARCRATPLGLRKPSVPPRRTEDGATPLVMHELTDLAWISTGDPGTRHHKLLAWYSWHSTNDLTKQSGFARQTSKVHTTLRFARQKERTGRDVVVAWIVITGGGTRSRGQGRQLAKAQLSSCGVRWSGLRRDGRIKRAGC